MTTGDISTINSWNIQLVEVSGKTFTNTWSNHMPARINGKYYIHYVGQYRSIPEKQFTISQHFRRLGRNYLVHTWLT